MTKYIFYICKEDEEVLPEILKDPLAKLFGILIEGHKFKSQDELVIIDTHLLLNDQHRAILSQYRNFTENIFYYCNGEMSLLAIERLPIVTEKEHVVV